MQKQLEGRRQTGLPMQLTEASQVHLHALAAAAACSSRRLQQQAGGLGRVRQGLH